MPLRKFRGRKSDMRGSHNTRRENRLEELGRVDAEKAHTSKGKRNLREEKDRIRKELKSGGPPAGRRSRRTRKGGLSPSQSPSPRPKDPEQRRKPRGAGPSGKEGQRKEDSSETLGKFMKAKIDSKESTVKKGGIGADRVLSKYRNPESAAKWIKSGGLRKNVKDAAYYKSIGLTGKRGDEAVKDFFTPVTKRLKKFKPQIKDTPSKKLKPLITLKMKTGGRAKGPNRPRPTGPHMWVRGDKRKKYASGGAVMAGKKVGIQIK